jgi:molybdopterin/thiamine biosynthesis adenylyltransferase
MNTFARLMNEIRGRIEEIGPIDAWQRLQSGALLVDVREEHEWAIGQPAGSLGLPRSHIEFQIERAAPDRDQEILLICAAGARSLLVADALQRMGYRNVASVAGGFGGWRAAGLPVEEVDALDAEARERYDRHLRLPEIGAEGQRRLLDSRVLVVGAGGLGSPSALYLAAAGIGTLGIVDDDRVERSNLQRQVLHADAAIGEAKVRSAAQRLSALNPGIRIEAVQKRFVASNADELLDGYDLVIDGADNFPTRYLINETCLRSGTPWVYGAVQGFTGQASLFVPGQGPCYRCLFPEPPPREFAPNCAEAGVLGVLPGVIGLIQATEAIKWQLGLGEPLLGHVLTYDALSMRFSRIALPRDPECPGCGGR